MPKEGVVDINLSDLIASIMTPSNSSRGAGFREIICILKGHWASGTAVDVGCGAGGIFPDC